MRTTVSLDSIGALVNEHHENPYELLGPHPVDNNGNTETAVRAYLPSSSQVWILDGQHQQPRPMRKIHPSGIFEAICSGAEVPKRQGCYQLQVADNDGRKTIMHDPYAFEPLLTEYDKYLLQEGTHWNSYDRLGAQLRTVSGVSGVNFAVWAPNAVSVSVVGDFNYWDGRAHQMRKNVPSGIWELFVPGIGAGEIYKYRVKGYDRTIEKADPYGFHAELPPRTASVVADLNSYQWKDDQWIQQRREYRPYDRPMSIYEVHLGSWRRCPETGNSWLSYRELAHGLAEYCTEMGYTHVELLPVSEHPFSGSWGYQTVGYFSINSRHGGPEDFMYFVDHMHRNGIGVLIDWVPAHFPKDDHGLRRFDGTALYEHADPRQGEHPDWGTMIFNYGRTEVRNFLISNALFWLDKYHVDGLRVDAVASMLYLDYSREAGQWIPNEYGGRENLPAISFLKAFNERVHHDFPGVLTIAEESTAWEGVSRPTYTGGLGFSFKWNMGWMNDTRQYMHREPIHRKYHHNNLTFSLIYAFSENFVLPLSHDEVVHGKGSMLDQMPGDLWQKFANLRLLYAYMWTHPGKKMLFMGDDFGQWCEWNYDKSLDWDLLQWDTHQGVKKLVADLNALYRREPSLYEIDSEYSGHEWVDCHDFENSVLAYVRKARDPRDIVVVCCNFTPVVRYNYRIGVPYSGWYNEIFNTDSKYYGGSNVGNYPGVKSEPLLRHGRPQSIELTLPPLACIVLKPEIDS